MKRDELDPCRSFRDGVVERIDALCGKGGEITPLARENLAVLCHLSGRVVVVISQKLNRRGYTLWRGLGIVRSTLKVLSLHHRIS